MINGVYMGMFDRAAVILAVLLRFWAFPWLLVENLLKSVVETDAGGQRAPPPTPRMGCGLVCLCMVGRVDHGHLTGNEDVISEHIPYLLCPNTIPSQREARWGP